MPSRAPEVALAQAMRVLRPGGRLAIFDDDYSTVNCALAASDPLQACVDAFLEEMVHDRRRTAICSPYSTAAPASCSRPGGWAPTPPKHCRPRPAAARDAGVFYGHIGYLSATATKP